MFLLKYVKGIFLTNLAFNSFNVHKAFILFRMRNDIFAIRITFRMNSNEFSNENEILCL